MTAVPPQLRKMLAPLKSCSRGKAVAGYWAFAVPLRPRSPTVCAIHRRTCTFSGSLRATLRIPCFSSVSRLYDTTFLSALQAHSAKFIVLRD